MRARTARPSQLLPVSTVAERLKVNNDTVRRYLKTGGLPFIRLPGGHIRVDEDALNEWVAQRWRQR